MRRTDDNEKASAFRSRERVFCLNGEWWFSTREVEQGPYKTKEAAQVDLDRYVRMMDKLGADPLIETKPVGNRIVTSKSHAGSVREGERSPNDDVIRGFFRT